MYIFFTNWEISPGNKNLTIFLYIQYIFEKKKKKLPEMKTSLVSLFKTYHMYMMNF